LKIRSNLNPKARAVNKAQQQLRPESYFLELFKSPALENINILIQEVGGWSPSLEYASSSNILLHILSCPCFIGSILWLYIGVLTTRQISNKIQISLFTVYLQSRNPLGRNSNYVVFTTLLLSLLCCIHYSIVFTTLLYSLLCCIHYFVVFTTLLHSLLCCIHYSVVFTTLL